MVSKKRAAKKREVDKRSAKLAMKTTGRRRSTRKRGIANRAGHDAIVIERRGHALQPRLAGARYRQIASELPVSVQTAYCAALGSSVGTAHEDITAELRWRS